MSQSDHYVTTLPCNICPLRHALHSDEPNHHETDAIDRRRGVNVSTHQYDHHAAAQVDKEMCQVKQVIVDEPKLP